MGRPELGLSLLGAALLAALLAACASGGAGSPAPASADPTFAHAEAVKAAERAPDLWARARDADALARAATDDDAAHDLRTEARLWRQAAIAEAERIALEAQIADVKAQAEARAKQLAKVQETRTEVVARAERLAAGRLALEEARRVLEVAATEPRRRPRLKDEAKLRRGSEALIERATLIAAAARALGADSEALDAVEERLSAARELLTRRPAEALHAADEALFDAQAALGPVRGQRADREARQSLVDALRVAGLDPRRSDRGLTARLTSASPGGELPARSLARLCKLREAFPAGAWQLALRDPQPARAARRAAALRTQLTSLGCEVERVDVAGAAGVEQPALEVSFLAY